MWRTIEKIRAKSDVARKRLALSISALVTVLIFGIWLSVWYGQLTNNEGSEEALAVVEKSDSPLATVKNTFSQVFGEMIEQVGTIQNSVKINLAAIEEYSQATSTDIEVRATSPVDEVRATTTASSTASTTTDRRF